MEPRFSGVGRPTFKSPGSLVKISPTTLRGPVVCILTHSPVNSGARNPQPADSSHFPSSSSTKYTEHCSFMSCAVLRTFRHFHSANPHASVTTFRYKMLLFYAPPRKRKKRFPSNKPDYQVSDTSPFWRNLTHSAECVIMDPFYRPEHGGSKLLLAVSSLVDSSVLVPSISETPGEFIFKYHTPRAPPQHLSFLTPAPR